MSDPKDIIQRKIGYSDEMMLRDILIAYKVLTQSQDIIKKSRLGVKKGEPAKEILIGRKMKFNVPKELIEQHKRSIEYYGGNLKDYESSRTLPVPEGLPD